MLTTSRHLQSTVKETPKRWKIPIRNGRRIVRNRSEEVYDKHDHHLPGLLFFSDSARPFSIEVMYKERDRPSSFTRRATTRATTHTHTLWGRGQKPTHLRSVTYSSIRISRIFCFLSVFSSIYATSGWPFEIENKYNFCSPPRPRPQQTLSDHFTANKVG